MLNVVLYVGLAWVRLAEERVSLVLMKEDSAIDETCHGSEKNFRQPSIDCYLVETGTVVAETHR